MRVLVTVRFGRTYAISIFDLGVLIAFWYVRIPFRDGISVIAAIFEGRPRRGLAFRFALCLLLSNNRHSTNSTGEGNSGSRTAFLAIFFAFR